MNEVSEGKKSNPLLKKNRWCDMSDTQTKQYKNTVFIAVMVLLVGAACTMHQFKVPTIMGHLMQSLNMNANTASWTMSIFTLVGVFLAIPAGGLCDKLNGKRSLALSFLLAAGGSVIGGFATSPELMLFSRAIEGIGFVLVSVAGPLAIRQSCNPAQIGRAMGFWGGYVALGQIIALNLTTILYDLIGWQNIWFTYASVTVVLGLVAQFTLTSPAREDTPGSTGAPAEKTSFGTLLANKNLMLACIGFAFFNLLVMATVTFLPQALTSKELMSPAMAAFVTSVPMIGCIFFSPVFGRWSESIGLKKIYLVSILALGAAMILAYQPSVPVVWIGVIIGGVLGMNAPAMMFAAIGQWVQPKEVGLAMGICMTLQNCGMFLGTAVFVPIQEAIGGSFVATSVIIAVPTALIGFFLVKAVKFK